MTELEKLRAGLEYDLWDPEISGMKKEAMAGCDRLNALSLYQTEEREAAIRALFGKVGAHPSVNPVFHCDCGKNIEAGDNLLINYNVTILDRGPVTIGNDVLIGPGCVITTTGHPMNAEGRRRHLGYMRPVKIGNDVWMGGNVTVLPGVTIGNNVVIAAGAVVNHDVPDNCLVGGVPARIIRQLEE